MATPEAETAIDPAAQFLHYAWERDDLAWGALYPRELINGGGQRLLFIRTHDCRWRLLKTDRVFDDGEPWDLVPTIHALDPAVT